MTRNVQEIIDRQINRWNSVAELLRKKAEESPEVLRAKSSQLHPVICFSRDLGSGSRLIAKAVCERLGYELFGSAIIDQIAEDLHVQRRLVDSLDERARGELEMMLETYLHGREIDSREYFTSLVRVLKALALKGGTVLLGRGAPFLLRDQAALSVLITGPRDGRIRRIMGYEHIDEPTARRKLIESDAQRERFVRKYFDRDVHDWHNFDLIINTDRIPPERAGEVILKAIEARGHNLDRMKIALNPAVESPT